MEYKELSDKARRIKEAYNELNQSKGKKIWGVKDYAQGLAGDTGDLLKLIMKFENQDNPRVTRKELRHELADCLWSLIVLSQELEVDLENEFIINTDYLIQKLSEEYEE